MDSFLFEYWYRYSNGNQKDFDQVTIESESEEKAREEVGKLRSNIFKIDLIKEELCQDV